MATDVVGALPIDLHNDPNDPHAPGDYEYDLESGMIKLKSGGLVSFDPDQVRRVRFEKETAVADLAEAHDAPPGSEELVTEANDALARILARHQQK
jgi:hypothetical protein